MKIIAFTTLIAMLPGRATDDFTLRAAMRQTTRIHLQFLPTAQG